MTRNHSGRFLHRLLAASLLGWALSTAAQGVSTFEGNGVIQRLDPLSQQVVIDGQRYALPAAVAQKATDQHGARVALQRGMLVSFYGSVSGRDHEIQGISMLRWSGQ
ncbi:MAG TPA: PilY2 family type 4a fimbrial biogenesis protein [Nitrococcus sp.]|nr:PilY2 family type 4a fimbrial biogenesis protein [Nitrococcus sp.]